MSRKFADNFRMAAALLAGVVLCGTAAGAGELDAGAAQDLKLQMTQAQSQADTLERELARAKTDNLRVADLFGESDEEKAARLQHEQNQDQNIATLTQRLGDLEETLRRLTGQVEQLDHRLTELGERATRMQKDFDYKLCSLAAQQLGAQSESSDQPSTLPCTGTSQQGSYSGGPGSATPQPPAASGGPTHLAPPPGVLGTLTRNDAANPPGAQPSATQFASLDARPQFESALNLLAKAQYDEARAAFRSFADAYPKDELAPQAIYWVGDIAYVQKDYPNAARAFAEELKKYPSSPRAPESMLKLGQSLLSLNQKKEGCTALGALSVRYPTASKSISDQALNARKTAGCR
ncbi:MAG TPA: tol-pal system protein YbgF [Rhizomicrobium sp.]